MGSDFKVFLSGNFLERQVMAMWILELTNRIPWNFLDRKRLFCSQKCEQIKTSVFFSTIFTQSLR